MANPVSVITNLNINHWAVKYTLPRVNRCAKISKVINYMRGPVKYILAPLKFFLRGLFWLPKKVWHSIIYPTAVTKTRWALFGIILLTILAGLIDYPAYYNQGTDWFNSILDKNAVTTRVDLPKFKVFPFHLGLDLQGGAHLVYEADTTIVRPDEAEDAVNGARDVIERRVNVMGVSEPLVQINRQGDKWRIIVELPGVQDVNQAINQIGETPLLEFKELPPPLTPEEQGRLDEANKAAEAKANELNEEVKKPDADFAKLVLENSEDPGSVTKGGDLDFFKRGAMVQEFDTAVFDQLKVGEITPAPVKTIFGWHIIKKTEERGAGEDLEARASHILLRTKNEADVRDDGLIDMFGFARTQLTGEYLKRSQVTFDPNTNEPVVNLEFNSDGAKLFEEITSRNLNKIVAIYLDGEPISTPKVNQVIAGGQAIITGNFTLPEAKTLSQRLNAGALPLPVTLISQQTVGPTLGAESLDRSLKAGLAGLILVAIFMILYYRLPGFLAVLTLIVYGAVTLALFKLVPVTLTLSGIAGFILSLGMAVDANVLIFERLKEELAGGRPLLSAIDEGFKRAWSSIRDGNASTLITCFILATFTTSMVKGFAITLAVGIIISMFSAIFVTRNIMKTAARSRWFLAPWLYGAIVSQKSKV